MCLEKALDSARLSTAALLCSLLHWFARGSPAGRRRALRTARGMKWAKKEEPKEAYRLIGWAAGPSGIKSAPSGASQGKGDRKGEGKRKGGGSAPR